MCGIATIFNYNAPPDRNLIERFLVSANKLQAARGPDGEGIWISDDGKIGLAHTRLAIIDLTERAAQPMSSEDGIYRITFNGEIYNYKQLRSRLEARGYRFLSQSDTEVLLNLYKEYGRSMVKHIRGMYAFALWDNHKSGIFLARDPFGIKPLYYADDGHVFSAASQVKTLLLAGNASTSLEPAGHVGFFLWGFVPDPYTLYKGIRSLPAGTTLWISSVEKKMCLNSFCDIADEFVAQDASKNVSHGEARKILGESVEDSVRHHMVSDVPVGVFLSAGLDSASIASLAAHCNNEPLKTVTLRFAEFEGRHEDESDGALRIAQELRTDHSTYSVCREDFRNDLEHIFSAMDQPTIDGINTYYVSKAASSKGLKVVLSGVGGDELFGTYPSFKDIPRIMASARFFHKIGVSFRRIFLPVVRWFASPKYAGIFEYGNTPGAAYLLRRGLFMPWEIPDILDPDLAREGFEDLDPVARINDTVPSKQDIFSVISVLEMKWYMRNMLLRDTDWASMCHSLEIRLPLVDIELLKGLSPIMRNSSRPDKLAFAQCAWRGSMPAMLLHRAKTGFGIPIREWLPNAGNNERGLRGWARLVYGEMQRRVPKPAI